MLNVITLFSGYDSQCLALNRLGMDYDLVAWSEIDTNAIKAHNALFPQWQDRNLGDVSKVDWQQFATMINEPVDLLTYSSPCQDFSSAGLQKGGQQGSGTRSSLLWECERAIEQLRPKYLLFENVSALVSKKFRPTFFKWCLMLEKLGYTNHYQLMNAKAYGVPQNRLRIFMVSILDCPRAYYFPKPFKLERRLKDVLEQNVAERYYLKDEQVEKLMAGMKTDGEARCIQIGQLYDKEDNPQNGRIYDPDGLCPSIMANKQGGQREPKIAEPQMLGWTRNEKGEITDRHPVSVANCVTAGKRDNTQNYVVEPTIAAMRGRDKDNPNDRGKSTDNYTQRLELKPDGTSNTLTSVAKDNYLIEPGIRIRRLTERELYRLMDVSESDIDTLLNAGISNTQLAKMAGNSIVVNVLFHIFRTLFVDTKNTDTQLTIFD